MRARAAANAASKSAPSENETEHPPALPKVEDVNIPLLSLPPALVGTSSSRDYDAYPQPTTYFGRSNTDAAELHDDALSNSIPASDGYPHIGIMNEASKIECSPLESDFPLVFRRRLTSESAHTTLSAVHQRKNVDPLMVTVRPRVKLYHEVEPEDYDEENELRPSDSEPDLPYVPGPDAENNLRCLKWLTNVGKSGGHKRS